jgi:hypothetical protein
MANYLLGCQLSTQRFRINSNVFVRLGRVRERSKEVFESLSGRVTQVVECVPSKCTALNSTPVQLNKKSLNLYATARYNKEIITYVIFSRLRMYSHGRVFA